MALLKIKNVSPDPVSLSDFYVTIQPGAEIEVSRAVSDLARMVSLQRAVAAGQIGLSVTYSDAEVGSGGLQPPACVEAVDLAPVLESVAYGPLVSIYRSIPAGTPGSPDDVTLFPLGMLPAKLRVLDFFAYVQVPAGATFQLRDEPNGVGAVLASCSSYALGRQNNTLGKTTVVDQTDIRGLFVRRSDGGAAAEVVVFLRPEL